MSLERAKKYIEARRLQRTVAGRSICGVDGADVAPRAVGRLQIEVRPAGMEDDERAWVKIHDDDNLVVTQAEDIMAQMAIGAANSALSYIELGDPAFPATPPALADIALEQTTGQRKSVTLTATGNVVRAEVTWGLAEGNGFVYTEAGLFNGLLGAGLMFARKVFSPITKTAAFQMKFTWHITFLVNSQGGACSGVSLVGPGTVSPHTIYTASGGEASVAATFDFSVGANVVDVFLNRQRLYPTLHYVEAAPPLTAPVGGPAGNKGVNLVAFTLIPNDEVLLIARQLA